MKQQVYRVVGNAGIWADIQCMTLDAPDLAQVMRPGQFALLRDPRSFDPYLRRTAWFYEVASGAVALALPASDALAQRTRTGDLIDAMAPLGHAINLPGRAHHVLVVSEGSRAAPLIGAARDAVQQGNSVVFSLIAVDDRAVLPAHLLPPEIEYQTGAAVNRELVAWADVLVASGSTALYHRLDDEIRAVRMRLERGFMQVLVEQPMPCGTGDCWACAVETARGIKRACTDGPWFDWMDVRGRAG